MSQPTTRNRFLTLLFLLGCLLFNYPPLAAFNQPAFLFGVPLLFVYVFAAWAVLIGLVAAIVERR